MGTVGTAYVRGCRAPASHATLKHFVGYSASRAGRNLAPVHAGPREIADVLLAAVRDGRPATAGSRSVMHSYAEIDGVPVAADRRLLTDLLRERVGLRRRRRRRLLRRSRSCRSLHGVAADLGEAAGARAGRRRRRRAAHRQRLPRAAGGGRARPAGRRGAGRPRRAAGAAPEGGARPARRRRLRGRGRRRDGRPRPRRAPGARRPAGRGVGGAADQRRRAAAGRGRPGTRRRRRAQRRPPEAPSSAATPSPTTSSAHHPGTPIGPRGARRC